MSIRGASANIIVFFVKDVAMTSHTVHRFERVYAVCWSHLDSEALRAIASEMARLRVQLGTPLIYLAVVDAEAPIPTREQRQELIAFSDQVLRAVDAVHLVFEGDSLKHSVQRAVLTGLLLFARSRAKVPIKVWRLASEALDDLAKRLDQSRDQVAAGLRQAGVPV
jgi:hypothetical protein